MSNKMAPPGTIEALLRYLDDECLGVKQGVPWPPDAFLYASAVLHASGAYTEVLVSWPPREGWVDEMQALGKNWASLRGATCPDEVTDRWNTVIAAASTPLREIAGNRDLVIALLELVAAADEACVGFGLPCGGGEQSELEAKANLRLTEHGTLSLRVDAAKAQVLPKFHSPKNGLTLRSLTHHLALHMGSEVVPMWTMVPTALPATMNLLLLPWPLVVVPSQFSMSGAPKSEHYGLFSFSPGKTDEMLDAVVKAIREATRLVGKVSGVILPELSIDEEIYERLRSSVHREGAFLIAGVAAAASGGEPGRNYLVFDNPGLPSSSSPQLLTGCDDVAPGSTHIEQDKHHRWCLDRSQVEMYGLGASLRPEQVWWEDTKIPSRTVNFIALNQDTTLCCLICEDLARQDPVGDLVRSVGPNLVIALLMDAAQLGVRWPARYATVLAEDPGSSVLTLTSAGMVRLARTPRGAARSSSIALWKDARSPSLTEIELPSGATGVVISLCPDAQAEYSADCRHDNGKTMYPRLCGVHAVYVDDGRSRD